MTPGITGIHGTIWADIITILGGGIAGIMDTAGTLGSMHMGIIGTSLGIIMGTVIIIITEVIILLTGPITIMVLVVHSAAQHPGQLLRELLPGAFQGGNLQLNLL